jgi:mono/diheme cytochrome c family protein
MMLRTFLFTVMAAATTYVAAQDAPAGNAQTGKALYNRYGCYQCHGYEAQGGAGKRLAPDPMPFVYITTYVRHPVDQMPPYTEKVVTNQELADIYAFLLSIAPPPALDSIQILNNQ